MMKIIASRTSSSRAWRAERSSHADGPCFTRSSKGFGPTKIAPAFELFERVAPENPAKATV